MLLAAFILLSQVTQIVEPYTFREDQGQTTKVVLKNGLTVLVREQQAIPLVSVNTYVKAGYFDEDDRISGISHVIEHMFFKGTQKRPVGEIARETHGLGGYLNAHTFYDRTVYDTEVQAENMKKALEIQADALWNSVYDATELKREIEVVLQENNRKLDNPGAVTSEKLYATAFQQHRMRRWRIGTPEGLRALTRDDIIRYVQKYYRPSNFILSIAGRLDIEETIAEVVKLYGNIPDDGKPIERDTAPAEPEQTAVRYSWQLGPIEQNHVALGFHTPGFLTDDVRGLEVLAAILGEGRASILNQYVRDEKGLITSGSANLQAFQNLGFFEIDFETAKPLEAQIGVLAEVEGIKKFGVTNEQLAIQELPVTAEIPSADDSLTHDLVKPVEKRSILRGPDVYIIEDHRLPLVSFGLFYPGGRLYESPKNAGITELMLRTALRGTQRFNSEDIARRLENAGARIQVVNQPDFFGYLVDGLSGKLGQALEILMDILQQPVFQEDDLEKEKVLQLARIKNLRENNYAYPVSVFMQTLFGEHAYARPAAGTETAVQSITKEDLQTWFKTNQRPLVPTIVVVADTQGTGLVAPLADMLTNEDLHEREIGSLPSPNLKAETKEAVENTSRQQTALVYGYPGISRSGNDRYGLVVLQNIVSGLGGRFFDAIREKQGLAYTVRTETTFFSKAGAVYTYVAFSPENETQVKESLEKEINRLLKDGVTADEVRKAIAYSIGEHEIGLQTRSATVLEYAGSIYSGEGVQGLANYARFIRGVTPEQVKNTAEAYFKPQLLRVAE